jgi:hypothetical protein
MRRSLHTRSKTRVLAGIVLGILGIIWAGNAEAQIKQPGAHPDYGVELDPHLVIQYAHGPFFDDEGIGVGLRASIPFVRNGPIPQINNNMGISFGGDIAFFNADLGCRSQGNGLLGDECDGTDIWLPVLFQWNFFFTKVVGAFFEIGPAVSYWHRSWLDDCGGGNVCERSASDLDLFNFAGFIGGRFLFSERVGMTVRLGTPYVSVGATFLL